MKDRATRVRLVNTIFVSQSLLTASQIAIITLLSILAVELSGSESLAGLPATALTLSTAFAALPIGIIMGRLGRRFGLTLSYGISIVGAGLGVLAIVIGAFWLLLLSSMLIGMGRAGADQSRFAAGDMFPDGESGRMIGRIVFAGTIGAVVGPLLITPGIWMANLLELDPDTGPWLVASVFYAVATLVTITLLYPEPNRLAAAIDVEKPKRKQKPTDEPGADGRSIIQLLQVPVVRLAVSSMLISQMVMVALMVITPLHMVHHAHGNREVSWVITAHTLGMFAFSSLTGYLIDRFGPVRVMLFGGLTLFASAVIAPLSATLPVLLFSLFLLGLGWNFGFIAGSSLLSNVLRGAERARMQGTGDMFVAGAAALGSFSSGPIYHWGGYPGVAALVGVLTLIFLYIIRLMGASAARPHPEPAV